MLKNFDNQGHTLGLDHSHVEKAVMFPWYQPYKPGGFDLNYDDIVGIQTLYGKLIFYKQKKCVF